jgi:hypothetical protein
MQWAGAGLAWSFAGGIPTSRLLGAPQREGRSEDFAFVQISDSHIGFDKAANQDVNGTFQAAVDKINSLDGQPDFILHTGDLSHLAKASEFDTLEHLLKGLKQKQAFFVPGEHDPIRDDGKLYRAYSAMGGVSGMGLGHQGQRAGARAAQTFRIGDGSERAHPSDASKSGRERDIPYPDVHRVSSGRAGQSDRPRTAEGACGTASQSARNL